MTDRYQIDSLEELRRVVVTNTPQSDGLAERLYDYLDEFSQGFISDSPSVFFGTADDSGHVDVSPKGDAPGFVEILDEKTLLFPERMGNTDARNLRNILKNNQVSLLFIIPRTKDVLRVTGTATITKDPVLLARMVSCGKPAQLCIRINVNECFFHCGRAFNRSHIWVPDKWPVGEKKYMRNQIKHRNKLSDEGIEEMYEEANDFLSQQGETDGAY
ncbi:pyridoxamine 5'-phosphate oxidase family protein [Porticoccaceae bacterium]|nr:pyridoxamine 5'-phosphate oxidase family protein [Porticoccaceae bacterium]